ncbi:MAG: hypothetical protein QCI82_05525 [Candidatus Thermoplasmatota archaeon]|nr:hypothetical protein [Candidatus Thermoplasmatota archaeon]
MAIIKALLNVIGRSDVLTGVSYPELFLFLPSIVIMLIFYSRHGRSTPLFRAAGSILFGLYWLFIAQEILLGRDPDIINGVISALGGFLFLFIAFQLYLDHRFEENTRSIEWLLRMSALTGAFYFITEHVPAFQGGMIFIVAHLTYFVLRLFGFEVFLQSGFPSRIGEGLMITSPDPTDTMIMIVFECTAALALFLFTAAIIATETDRDEWMPWARKELLRTKGDPSLLVRSRRWGLLNMIRLSDGERKIRAFLMVVPLIFVVNIFRNVGVILAVHGDLLDFYTAHSIIAKVLSLLMMMFLTWVLFENLPELQENMVGLFDLRKRFKKGMIKKGRIDLKYV